jgi:hypothetical protein
MTEASETLALLQTQPFLIVLRDSGRGWWIDSAVSGDRSDARLQEVITEVENRYPVSSSSNTPGGEGD